MLGAKEDSSFSEFLSRPFFPFVCLREAECCPAAHADLAQSDPSATASPMLGLQAYDTIQERFEETHVEIQAPMCFCSAK